MPQNKRTAQERGRLQATEAAALAALSISESLMLAMVESGCLDPHIVRRCLLDAVTAHDNSTATGEENSARRRAVHKEALKLIDNLLRQLEAAAPSGSANAGSNGCKARLL